VSVITCIASSFSSSESPPPPQRQASPVNLQLQPAAWLRNMRERGVCGRGGGQGGGGGGCW
jgi:hypothetical protein